jgi:hypothetical protein
MSLFFCSYVSKKDPDKCKVFCKVQTQSPPVIPFFVFVGPAERCNLSNFGSPWCVAAASIQFFRKKVLLVCIVALLADGHTFRRGKRVQEKKNARDRSFFADLRPTH